MLASSVFNSGRFYFQLGRWNKRGFGGGGGDFNMRAETVYPKGNECYG